MKKTIIVFFVLCSTILFATSKNMFVIKNRDGTVVKGKKITHNKNNFFKDLVQEQKRLLSQLKKIKIKKADPYNYNKNSIVENAKQHLGERYVWGGTKPNAFDCSGYVKYLYEKEGISIPRTAYQQSKVGEYVERDELEKGDLLFFLTDKKRNIPITHVGLYLGDDKFIHAASKKDGVIISSLSKSRYNKIYVKAKRIIR
jgi:cell wall-associated NlpC family hydrolase